MISVLDFWRSAKDFLSGSFQNEKFIVLDSDIKSAIQKINEWLIWRRDDQLGDMKGRYISEKFRVWNLPITLKKKLVTNLNASVDTL